MNHLKAYKNIIEKARIECRIRYKGSFYENHHIIPKCVGGTNKKENLILLTPREHFVCHKLLIYIYPHNSKIMHAFYMMAVIKKKKSIYKVSSRDYSRAKEQLKIFLSSEEVKQKRKDTIYKKYYSPEAIDKYLDSLKDTYYSPRKDPVIHVSIKNKELNKTDIDNIKENIKYLNKQGCYVGFKV